MNSFILWGLPVTNPVPIWLKFLVHISPVRAVSITPTPFPAPAPSAHHSSTSAPTPTSLVVSAPGVGPTPPAVLASAPLIMAMSLLIRPWMTLGLIVKDSGFLHMYLELNGKKPLMYLSVNISAKAPQGPSGMLREAII